jgi:glycosyltransferase involved in cell wall biosynthesis
MKRITFLYSHPIQYFAPLLRQVNAAGFCKCRVLYCEDTTQGYFDKEFGRRISWDTPLLNGYDYYFLPNSWFSRIGGFLRLSNLSARKEVGKNKTDILAVHGWGYFTAIFAIVWARLQGTEVWLRGENPLNQEMQKPAWVRLFKKLFLQYGLFRMVSKFLYIGEQNRLFYEYFGVPASKLIFCPYAVDNEQLQGAKKNGGSKTGARQLLGLPANDFIVLFSGKLIAKKNSLDLVAAFHQAAVPNSTLVLLGDGELQASIQAFIKTNNSSHTVMAGFKNQTELPAWFVAADIFVLPSGIGETWGLVVNEAMNYGLPVLVSSLVGCGVDLVHNGDNGYLFPLGDTDALSELLKTAADPDWRSKAGARSAAIISRYSYTTIIQNLQQAMQSHTGA